MTDGGWIIYGITESSVTADRSQPFVRIPRAGDNVAGAAVILLSPVAMGRNLECGHFAPAVAIRASSGTRWENGCSGEPLFSEVQAAGRTESRPGRCERRRALLGGNRHRQSGPPGRRVRGTTSPSACGSIGVRAHRGRPGALPDEQARGGLARAHPRTGQRWAVDASQRGAGARRNRSPGPARGRRAAGSTARRTERTCGLGRHSHATDFLT